MEQSGAAGRSGGSQGRWARVIVLVVVIGLLGFVTLPSITRAKKSADLTTATSSLRCMGIFLFCFEEDWGTFPSGTILREHPGRFRGVREGSSSNAHLSMLIAGGYTTSELIFEAPGAVGAWKGEPDNVTSPASRLLEPGECGFGYVMLEGGRGMTDQDNGGRPIMVTPLERGESGPDPRFDGEPYNGRAVYLRIDQSVKQNRVGEDGRVMLPGNFTLFGRGPDTVWGDEVPEVVPPEW